MLKAQWEERKSYMGTTQNLCQLISSSSQAGLSAQVHTNFNPYVHTIHIHNTYMLHIVKLDVSERTIIVILIMILLKCFTHQKM